MSFVANHQTAAAVVVVVVDQIDYRPSYFPQTHYQHHQNHSQAAVAAAEAVDQTDQSLVDLQSQIADHQNQTAVDLLKCN